jgi:hypothetical protein
MTRRPTKSQRRRALAAYLDGLPDPPEFPDEITIHQDGRVLHGTGWTLPTDYQTEEVTHDNV